MDKEDLWYIKLHYACYGVTTVGGYIQRTAPIAKWSRGKHISVLRKFVEKHNGTITLFNPQQ